MKLEGGTYDTYSVDFGSVLTETTTKKWGVTGTEVKDVLDLLTRMQGAIQKKSAFGGTVVIKAGRKAFFALSNYIMGMSNDSRVQGIVSNNKITFAGFDIELHAHTYYDFVNKKQIAEVDDNKIVMVATDAPFTLYYLAIDDVEAGLQPLPLWVTTETTKNPSGVKLYCKSKPLPVPVASAICWCEVI